jgi:urease accessory protein
MQLAEPLAQSWKASLSLRFESLGGKTLARRESEGPLVVQKPLYPEGPELCHAIVVHPPGGIASGDELVLQVGSGKDSAALLTTPGAAKWYRSAGPWAKQRLCFDVGGSLEWLPRETIVFDGALAEMECEVRLAEGARYIGWEIVCLGRTGSGEKFKRGKLKLETRVFAQDELVWIERGAIDGGGAVMDSPAGLAGRTVFGTFVAAAPGLGGLQVARYLGDSTEEAFGKFSSLWKKMRPAVMRRPAVEPRLWST